MYEVQVTVQGKDVEHWAGNYGPRFRSEKLYSVVKGQSDVTKKIAVEQARISPVNFSCDFNFGYGQTYFIEG